jgi:hypothetical protein
VAAAQADLFFVQNTHHSRHKRLSVGGPGPSPPTGAAAVGGPGAGDHRVLGFPQFVRAVAALAAAVYPPPADGLACLTERHLEPLAEREGRALLQRKLETARRLGAQFSEGDAAAVAAALGSARLRGQLESPPAPADEGHAWAQAGEAVDATLADITGVTPLPADDGYDGVDARGEQLSGRRASLPLLSHPGMGGAASPLALLDASIEMEVTDPAVGRLLAANKSRLHALFSHFCPPPAARMTFPQLLAFARGFGVVSQLCSASGLLEVFEASNDHGDAITFDQFHALLVRLALQYAVRADGGLIGSPQGAHAHGGGGFSFGQRADAGSGSVVTMAVARPAAGGGHAGQGRSSSVGGLRRSPVRGGNAAVLPGARVFSAGQRLDALLRWLDTSGGREGAAWARGGAGPALARRFVGLDDVKL